MPQHDLTAERLREVLDYNPETGGFAWRAANGRRGKPGLPAGRKAGKYVGITVDGKAYLAHRLAWLYVHGCWPPAGYIDHANGDPKDNRIANLREGSNGQNMQNQVRAHSNNRTGLLGVSSHKSGRFVAGIRRNGRYHYLGIYDTPQEAHDRYLQAKREIHEFGMLPAPASAPAGRARKTGAGGFAGVELNPRTGRYRAFYHAGRTKKVHVGYFDTPEQASAARAAAIAEARGAKGEVESLFADV